MDQPNLPELIEPKWRAAFARFVETGEAEEEFLDYLNSNPEAQAAVERAFSKQAAALEELAGAMSAALSGAPTSPAASASGAPSLVRRSMSYLTPAALAACVLLTLLTVRFASVTKQTERELVRAETAGYEQRQQAERYKTELAAAQDEHEKLRYTIQRAQDNPDALRVDLRAIEQLTQEKAQLTQEKTQLAKTLEARESALAAAQARLATTEKELTGLKTQHAAGSEQLKAKDAELASAQQRLATVQKQLAQATASRPAQQATPTWLASTFEDASAFEWHKLQDRNYAASWTKDAFVTDFKVDASGRVTNTGVVKHSQTVDARAWALGDHGVVPGVKTYDGKPLPSNVTCIVLPATPENSGNK